MCGGPRDFLAWSTWAQENAYSLERGVVGRGGWEGVRGPQRTQKSLPHLHAPAGHQDSQQEDLGLPAFCSHQGPSGRPGMHTVATGYVLLLPPTQDLGSSPGQDIFIPIQKICELVI